MALQDLTPQLRTRLSRMERAVGIFVGLAALLLLSGFFYYLYHTATRKGWFLTKVTYFTYVDRADGLKEGDPVKLMGLLAGEITRIVPEDPNSTYNIYIEFKIKEPTYGYIWFPDSGVKVTAADFLGNRYLEVTKGGNSGSTNYDYHATYRDEVIKGKKVVTGVWLDKEGKYAPITKDSKYWLLADESPALTERLEKVARQVDQALPHFLNLTNQLMAVLTNSAQTASNLNALALSARPTLGNLADITTQLREFDGSLGRWLFSTNLNRQFELAAINANATLGSADTNLVALAEKLSLSLDKLANITSNLNAQVRSNTNVLSQISAAVVHSDELVQGLKRHWLLRSAFKTKATNPPPRTPLFRPGRAQP